MLRILLGICGVHKVGVYMDQKQRGFFWFVVVLATAVGFALYYWRSLDIVSPFLLGDDAAQYVLLSRSIVQGHGYHSIWIDGFPLHLKFPFGLPLLFAAASCIGSGWAPFFLVPVMAAGGALVMIFYLLREREAPLLAWGVVLLTGMTSLMCLYARSLLSEVPFMFFLMAALFLADRHLRKVSSGRREAVLFVFVMVGVSFLRTAGVLLPFVFLILLLAGHRWRVSGLGVLQKIVAVSIIVPIIIWLVAGYFSEAGAGESYWFLLARYVDPVKGMVGSGSVYGAVLTCLKGGYALVFYAIPSAMTNCILAQRVWWAGLLTGVVGVGWWFCFRRYKGILEIFFVVYLLGLSVWPWVQSSGIRMVLPVLPLLYYYFLSGVGALMQKVFPKRVAVSLLSVCLGVFAFMSIRHGVLAGEKMLGPSASVSNPSGMELAFSWIRQNTPSTALFLSPVPASVYLYAGRKSMSGPALYGLSDDDIKGLFGVNGFDYVFDPAAVIWRREALGSVRERLELVYEAGGSRIYKVRQGP
ncbi:MAG: hypothetical protein V2A70_09530 [Candidatus Omnitrophota bacterium]